MPLDPARLPLPLAGPVLRRVEGDLICVWIATSKPCNASLLLFDGAAIDTALDGMHLDGRIVIVGDPLNAPRSRKSSPY